MKIVAIHPTVYLKKAGSVLKQLIRVDVHLEAPEESCRLDAEYGQKHEIFTFNRISNGTSSLEIYLEEVLEACPARFILSSAKAVSEPYPSELPPSRHWTVHIVQISHHDLGYTNIPSFVETEHIKWLDQAVDYACQTENLPDDARFRIVIEQAWSLDHYIRTSSAEKTEKIISLLRNGRFELTGLWGNMVTELCSHEELIRALYPSMSLARRYGFEVISAEHNDIPGFSYGMAEALAGAGIKLLCAGIPAYHRWAGEGAFPVWDEEKLFPKGVPGAFNYLAPSGKSILFWCNNRGCGGDFRPSLAGLAETLAEYREGGYPYDIIRWPVQGGARDNSPYIPGYSYTIGKWNEEWAYPRLVCSTNALFYKDFTASLPGSLPVIKGEFPGQDYPAGAISTALATGVNRCTQSALPAAEAFASFAALTAGFKYPEEFLSQAWKDILTYDEHSWGFHFPCGPAAVAANAEKSVHAFRASAIAHDVLNRAAAKISDNIPAEEKGCYIAVLNHTAKADNLIVDTSMRELDNCGSSMHYVTAENDTSGEGFLQGVLLGNRWHSYPPDGFLTGAFRLMDIETGKVIPYELQYIDDPMEPLPYAAERTGLGSGTGRIDYQSNPSGLKIQLRFIAENVPAMGIKLYQMISCPESDEDVFVRCTENESPFCTIENEFYQISAAKLSGKLTDIYDKLSDRQWIDHFCPYPFFRVLVHDPRAVDKAPSVAAIRRLWISSGNISISMNMEGSASGHPVIRQSITLYKGFREIHFTTRILKDSTPLLEVQLAFPFSFINPELCYDGVLCAIHPYKDFITGMRAGVLATGKWIRLEQPGHSMVLSSPDTPLIGVGGYAHANISYAHSCIFKKDEIYPLMHERQTKGWIFPHLFQNNFDTNFSVSQPGDFLFHHVITTSENKISENDATAFANRVSFPAQTMFTLRNEVSVSKSDRKGASSSFITIKGGINLLAFKLSEDGRGFILRLWNRNKTKDPSQIVFDRSMPIHSANKCDLAEKDMDEALIVSDNTICMSAEPREIVTIRIGFLSMGRYSAG